METQRKIILKTHKSNENTFVHSDITKHLKTHQIDGIKFLFENCYEQNSGCILAHCMGLGKTLQVIALLHAAINSPQYSTNKILVLCPISTIINWKEEIVRWLGPIQGHRKLKIFELDQKDDINRKISSLRNWSECDNQSSATVLIMGYDAFRNLVNSHLSKANAKKYSAKTLEQISEAINNYLLKPADIVICDEGHNLKNPAAATTLAVNKIHTKRRIILTGTPMQNHLMEYYSMVNFVKPNFLGTKQYFNEYFAEPIKAGQHADSCEADIKYMKQRSYALNKKLSNIVQRREISLLKDFLPEKFEFVLFVPLTEIQYKLYKYFIDNRGGVIEYKRLFGDYTCLRKIWTHLKVLDNAHQKSVTTKKRRATKSNDDENSNNDDDDDDDGAEYAMSGELQLVNNDWWRKIVDKSHLESALSSNKIILLFEILKECERVGDKCVIFSGFVEVLNVVEYFMQQINQQRHGSGKTGLEDFRGPWKKNEDYFRLDGSTPKERRHSMITRFNDAKNTRTKVFLISAKAGGLGINLFGANRLILLDTSWNPSTDQQSIFRIYRMGQTKHCYIYRLLSMGTMEEKIYSRSVTKQAMSCRVVDKQQIDRHYSMDELCELYSLTKTNWAHRPIPNKPKDNLLAHLLQKHPNMIYKYLEHDTLLANKTEEELNDIEKHEAWKRCQEQNLQMQALSNMTVEHSTPFPLQNAAGQDKSQNGMAMNSTKYTKPSAVVPMGKHSKTDNVERLSPCNDVSTQTAMEAAEPLPVEMSEKMPQETIDSSSPSMDVPVQPENTMDITPMEATEPSEVDMGYIQNSSFGNHVVTDSLSSQNSTTVRLPAESEDQMEMTSMEDMEPRTVEMAENLSSFRDEVAIDPNIPSQSSLLQEPVDSDMANRQSLSFNGDVVVDTISPQSTPAVQLPEESHTMIESAEPLAVEIEKTFTPSVDTENDDLQHSTTVPTPVESQNSIELSPIPEMVNDTLRNDVVTETAENSSEKFGMKAAELLSPEIFKLKSQLRTDFDEDVDVPLDNSESLSFGNDTLNDSLSSQDSPVVGTLAQSQNHKDTIGSLGTEISENIEDALNGMERYYFDKELTTDSMSSVSSQSSFTAPMESENQIEMAGLEAAAFKMSQRMEDSSDKMENLSFEGELESPDIMEDSELSSLEDCSDSKNLLFCNETQVPDGSQNAIEKTSMEARELSEAEISDKTDVLLGNTESLSFGSDLVRNPVSTQNFPTVQLPTESQNGKKMIPTECAEPLSVEKAERIQDPLENFYFENGMSTTSSSSSSISSQSYLTLPMETQHRMQMTGKEVTADGMVDKCESLLDNETVSDPYFLQRTATITKNLMETTVTKVEENVGGTGNQFHQRELPVENVPALDNNQTYVNWPTRDRSEVDEKVHLDDRKMNVLPAVPCEMCHCSIEPSGTPIETSNNDDEFLDNIEKSAARSLSIFARGLLQTLNANNAVPTMQEHDYTSEEHIITSNQPNTFEYRVAFKRNSNSVIQQSIKRLKLSLEIDATTNVDHISSPLPAIVNNTTVQHSTFNEQISDETSNDLTNEELSSTSSVDEIDSRRVSSMTEYGETTSQVYQFERMDSESSSEGEDQCLLEHHHQTNFDEHDVPMEESSEIKEPSTLTKIKDTCVLM